MSEPKTVLVVDDDQDISDIIAFNIKKAGFRVETAQDGVAAIGKIPVVKPDLIILDLMLPMFSGLDVLEQLQAGAMARIPVIVITGVYAQASLRERLARYPDVVEFIEKPVKADRLNAAVRKALAPPPSA